MQHFADNRILCLSSGLWGGAKSYISSKDFVRAEGQGGQRKNKNERTNFFEKERMKFTPAFVNFALETIKENDCANSRNQRETND